MKETLEFIAKALVEKPDEVSVKEIENEVSVTLELHVAESDMGKVIGRQGRIAKAIRTIVRSTSGNSSKKIIIDIV